MVVTLELAKKLEKAEIDCLTSRLIAIQDREGNPMKIDIQQYGKTTAFTAKNIPGPAFNVIKGFTDQDLPYLEEIIAHYEQKEIPVRLEIVPGQLSTDSYQYLNDLGLYQNDVHTSLYAHEQQNTLDSHPNIQIRPLKEQEFSLFGEIYTKSFGMPEFLQSAIAENNEVLFDRPGWFFYLATLNEGPAGIGVLYIKDQVATLAASGTLPEYRNKGIHTALIQARIQHAVQNGAKLIAGQAKVSSTSQNNMERCGLKIAYTKMIFAKKDS